MVKMVTVMVKTLLILTLVASLSAATKPDELLPLNLAPDSINDDFEGCKIENLKDILGDLVKVQLQTNKKLEEAWNKFGDTEDYVERALKVYSDKENGIYAALNEQMRTGRKDYESCCTSNNV
ncbi:ecto-ADP-ribosyltransferase 5-like [Colossoma macropomum]|uniref:ecto-ADP-ribosyltransferase 5-like n=1 Tax=Colossoma macropomum TaxID=42526 RepID=UPI001865250C|nr:ecto-ADP-ribosyltransferase 5-like [Colossoma macropomum]